MRIAEDIINFAYNLAGYIQLDVSAWIYHIQLEISTQIFSARYTQPDISGQYVRLEISSRIYIRLDIQPNIRPDIQPNIWLDQMPDIWPDIQPDIQPDI